MSPCLPETSAVYTAFLQNKTWHDHYDDSIMIPNKFSYEGADSGQYF